MRFPAFLLIALNALLATAHAQSVTVRLPDGGKSAGSITITVLPPIQGLPLLGAAVGMLDGRPIGGVGLLHIGAGNVWTLYCPMPYIEEPDSDGGKEQGGKPKDKNPHPKPWVLDLRVVPENEQRPGDQPAGEINNPDGSSRTLVI